MRPPLVVVPGVQGRIEYVQPAIDALARDFDVVPAPLCGERGARTGDAAADMDRYADEIAAVLDARGHDRAAICGISFGGLVALRFAATTARRTTALVLASVPGPDWRLRERHEIYARYPRLFGLLFAIESPLRLRRETVAALPGRRDRRRFLQWQARTFVTAPLSLSRMAMRARAIAAAGAAENARRVSAPTLIVTGEPALDRVVRVESTREYLRLMPQARSAVIARTGHLGSITRPEVFAEIVRGFVRGSEVQDSGVQAF